MVLRSACRKHLPEAIFSAAVATAATVSTVSGVLPNWWSPWVGHSVAFMILVLGNLAILSLRRRQTELMELTSRRVDQFKAKLSKAVLDDCVRREKNLGVRFGHPMRVCWSVERSETRQSADPSSVLVSAIQQASDCDTADQLMSFYLRTPRLRMAVAGESDSGKSVFALQLTRLLQPCGPTRLGSRVPVLFELASWRPETEKLEDWMARKLARDFTGLSRRVARSLVEAGHILPVFDGLDRIPRAQHEAATQIGTWIGKDLPFIITSQGGSIGDWSRDRFLAEVGPTVRLEPMRPADVLRYLDPQGSPAWRQIRENLEQYPRGFLAETLSSPLMTSYADIVYGTSGTGSGELLNLPGRETLRDHLMVKRILAAYPLGKQVAWLIEIALVMKRAGETSFDWPEAARMAPRRRRCWARTVFGGAFGLAAMTIWFFTYSLHIFSYGLPELWWPTIRLELATGAVYGGVAAWLCYPSMRFRRFYPDPGRIAYSGLMDILKAVCLAVLSIVLSVTLLWAVGTLLFRGPDLNISEVVEVLRAGWPLYLAILVSIIFMAQARTVTALRAESPLGSLRADRKLFLWRIVFFFVWMSGYLLWVTRFEWGISLWGGAFFCLLILKTSAW
jgi:hypothetical protein